MNFKTNHLSFSLFLAVLGLLCCAGFSLVVASGGYSLVEVCVGFSSRWLLLLQSVGSSDATTASLIVVAHWLGCPTVCRIFLDQGSSVCPLHWQTDSLPLTHQGSPLTCFFKNVFFFLQNLLLILSVNSCI